MKFKEASGTTTNCQLSSSCDTQHAGYNPIQDSWWLFIRGSIYNTLAPNYDMISTGGCDGANELGAYDVTDTLATCAARCDALETCISFEFRASDGTCQLSSSCDQHNYAVGGTAFDLYFKQRDG